MRLFYKPKRWIIIVDLLIIVFNILAVFLFLPLTTQTPFVKYKNLIIIFLIVWVVNSFIFKRYKSLSKTSFFDTFLRLLWSTLLTFLTLLILIYYVFTYQGYSINVLSTIVLGSFISIYLFHIVYHAFKYATQYEDIEAFEESEIHQAFDKPIELISEDAQDERKKRIEQFAGNRVFSFLEKNINIFSKYTHILTEIKLEELREYEPNKYNEFVLLKKYNNIRGINKLMAKVNRLLPADGLFISSYTSQHTTKQKIFKKHKRGVADFIYFFHFLKHRFLPKIFFGSQLYFDLTEGENRTLSKTEILGRLNYNGFKIERIAKVDGVHYVFARRFTTPGEFIQKRYGVLIKLKRHGKNGKLINVYKFRTMHPYAEYLQDYVYQQSSLAEGGKFRYDIRVTTIGKFMRKYWLDELPMLYNLLKGEMKLVGVRPLSAHYFSLYTKELQDLRIRHKPGLLPPFYAHMPKTLEEIEASEKTYLNECDDKGVFRTDIKYFFLILKNILIKKARSA